MAEKETEQTEKTEKTEKTEESEQSQEADEIEDFDRDSPYILPLSILPIVTPALNRARMIKTPGSRVWWKFSKARIRGAVK